MAGAHSITIHMARRSLRFLTTSFATLPSSCSTNPKSPSPRHATVVPPPHPRHPAPLQRRPIPHLHPYPCPAGLSRRTNNFLRRRATSTRSTMKTPHPVQIVRRFVNDRDRFIKELSEESPSSGIPSVFKDRHGQLHILSVKPRIPITLYKTKTYPWRMSYLKPGILDTSLREESQPRPCAGAKSFQETNLDVTRLL